MLKKLTMLTTLAALCFYATGCLEIEEKTTIQGNGECDMRFVIRVVAPTDKKAKDMKKDMKEDELREGLKGLEGVTLTDYSVRTIYGQVVADMKYHANRCAQLGAVYDRLPSKMESQTGPGIEATFSKKGYYKFRKRGKKIQITRTIGQLEKKKKRKKKENIGGELAAMMLGGVKMRFDLTVPTRLISSNAEEANGQTLQWIIPFSYLENHKVVLKAEIEATPELTQSLLGK